MTTFHDCIEFKLHFRKIQRAFNTFQSIKQFLATPCLPAALACLVTTNKLLSMGNMSLLCLILAHSTLHPLFSQVQVSRIVSWVFLDASKGQFNHTRRYFIQEVTVVGNYNHSALPA